jgi:hypothetical protein
LGRANGVFDGSVIETGAERIPDPEAVARRLTGVSDVGDGDIDRTTGQHERLIGVRYRVLIHERAGGFPAQSRMSSTITSFDSILDRSFVGEVQAALIVRGERQRLDR